jgi:capsular polysaccharide transport system ATP-binding protein
MIVVEGVSKSFEFRGGWRTALREVNLVVKPGKKVGILGLNGTGKSTLIRLIGGVDLPDQGRIERGMSVSWPLALDGGFQGSLTGYDNLKFICRIYGSDIDVVLPFVEEFAELGKYLYEPCKSYSSGMRARLGFAISMAIEFDCYLIDESLAVGDERFRERCHEELIFKRADRALVLVSHQAETVRELCDQACVLHEQTLHHFDDVDIAYAFYRSIVQ